MLRCPKSISALAFVLALRRRELRPEAPRDLDMRRVGDNCPARPGTIVVGDGLALADHDHPRQRRGDINEAANHARINGVIVPIETNVVFPP